MPALHNRDRDTSGYRDQRSDYRDEGSRDERNQDREISLGTGTILAIFFALALVCAVFFGLGYSMGRKSAQPSAAASTTAAPPSVPSTFSGSKPSAGSPAGQSSAAERREQEPDQAAPADPDSNIVTTPVSSSEDGPPAPRASVTARKEAATPTAATVRASATQPQAAAMPAVNPNGTSIVQIAAVSHQEDADVLIAALKKRGYAVFIRQEPQDHLLHVQVGPFATKKDAETMRQRLLSDGYNAIVK